VGKLGGRGKTVAPAVAVALTMTELLWAGGNAPGADGAWATVPRPPARSQTAEAAATTAAVAAAPRGSLENTALVRRPALRAAAHARQAGDTPPPSGRGSGDPTFRCSSGTVTMPFYVNAAGDYGGYTGTWHHGCPGATPHV
jgi:hypothetical protein